MFLFVRLTLLFVILTFAVSLRVLLLLSQRPAASRHSPPENKNPAAENNEDPAPPEQNPRRNQEITEGMENIMTYTAQIARGSQNQGGGLW